jgi:hypothetical protein
MQSPEAVKPAGSDGGAGPLVVTDGLVVARWPYASRPRPGVLVGAYMGPKRVKWLAVGPTWEARRARWAVLEQKHRERQVRTWPAAALN